MTLGEEIKLARERKNLSQEALAEQLDVSRQAVSKWENDSSIPQGVNRELLSQILDLDVELLKTEESVGNKKKLTWVGWLGWAVALVAVCLLCIVLTGQNRPAEVAGSDTQIQKTIKSVRFFDSNQNEVVAEALWYNAANIESILIQWDGGFPDNIKLFSTPSGTETTEMTELLLTKVILDGESVALLNADVLKDGVQSHVYFELDFGGEIISSDVFNVFFDGDLN